MGIQCICLYIYIFIYIYFYKDIEVVGVGSPPIAEVHQGDGTSKLPAICSLDSLNIPVT